MLKENLIKWEDILKPGTPFWQARLYRKDVKVKCPVCKGKGKVKLEGKEYECPECYGKGYEMQREPERWHAEGGFHLLGRDYYVVTRVDVEQTKKDGYYKVMYWDGCNGFAANTVFTSKGAAQREVNKLNAELEKVSK